jgi:hypothetical protein
MVRLNVQGPHLLKFDVADLPAPLDANDEVMSHLVLSHLIPGRRIFVCSFLRQIGLLRRNDHEVAGAG